MNILGYSLTALKILLGIILMGKASEYRYIHQVVKSSPEQTSTSVSDTTHFRNRSSSLGLTDTVSKPTNQQDAITQSSKAKSRVKKTKSLSDVERFTLCSNRIV